MTNDLHLRHVRTAGLVLGCIAGPCVGAMSPHAAGTARDADWSWGAGRLDTDVASLPQLTTPAEKSEGPSIGGFLRSSSSDDRESDRLGNGGVDLRWRGEDLFDLAVVVGAAMEGDRSTDDVGLTRGIPARSAAFADFDFGGRSARDANPFDLDAALGRRSDREDFDAGFMAVRGSFRPTDRTRIGLIATASGDGGGLGLVGFDLSQQVAGHEMRGWMQQRTGAAPDSAESDRSALGASLGGRFDELRYEVDWRRIGDGFETDLGSVRTAGSQALAGRIGWGFTLASSDLIRRIDLGIRGRFHSDLELVEQQVDLSWNALTVTMASGDRVSLGIDQHQRTSDDTVASDRSWFLLGWASSERLPIQIGNELGFGDRERGTETTWCTRTRWRAAEDVEFKGDVRWSRFAEEAVTEDDEDRLRTSIEAGLGIGGPATSRTALVLDTATETVSLRQTIGWSLGRRSEVDIAIEQCLPTSPIDREREIQARIGGRFVF